MQRRSTRRAFLESAAVGAAGLLAGCRPRCEETRGVAPVVEASGSAVGIQSVRDLGPQFLDNPVHVTGQDGATSVQLPDGRALWVFGDTIEGHFDDIRKHDLEHVLSNTGAIVAPQDLSQGVREFAYLTAPDGRRPRQLLPFAPDEPPARHRLWAIHGVCVGDLIYLYYHRITMLPGVDVFANFQLDGMGIARARVGEFQFERLVAPDGTRQFWKGDVPTYGVFVEQRADGYVYLWGSLMTGMYLARTRPEEIEDVQRYEYLVARPTVEEPDIEPRWGPVFEPAAPLFDSVPNEMSASYNPYLGKYIAVHTLLRENKLVLRTAPRITGPWSQPQVFHRPAMSEPDDLFYAGKEHPELARDGGRVVYVTYVNASTYIPHLVEVTLA